HRALPAFPTRRSSDLQQVPTLAVDTRDHVWVLNRSRQIRPDENGASTNPPRTDCCIAGPAVLEFDPEGNLLQGWGGPGYVPGWRSEEHTSELQSRVDL